MEVSQLRSTSAIETRILPHLGAFIGASRGVSSLLLIGGMLIVVGLGNVWIGHKKLNYYKTTYSRALHKGASVRSSPFSDLGVSSPRANHAATIAARRALSRIDYYWLVMCCGYFLIGSGILLILFRARVALPLNPNESQP